MKVRLQPHKMASVSARLLAEAMNIKRVNIVRTRFRPTAADVVINWGSGELAFIQPTYINRPPDVKVAQNKFETYQVFAHSDVPHPPWTQSLLVAGEWLDIHKTPVLARYLLRGAQGRGITLFRPEEYATTFARAPHAPLYVKYMKKRDEYRIHVLNAQVIDVQHKRKRRGFDERNNQIRNAANGWVFCREEIVPPPECVTDAAVRAVQALGLHFGAADVGYNHHNNSACVYEVNTAPGIEGRTVDTYARALREYINALT